MYKNCLICREPILENSHRFSVSDRRKGLTGTWQLIECNHCGVISMLPLPTDNQLASYYGAYALDNEVDLTRRSGTHHPRLRKIFHKFSGDVDPRDFVEIPIGAKVLDYGCGQASYLCSFHDQGVNIYGAEIDDHYIAAFQNNGLNVRKVNDLSIIPFEDGMFDIVYLMQVFEHIKYPHGFLNELSRILKKDGTLYLAFPNAYSIWRKVFKRNWLSGWFAPFHLFFYNHDAMALLANEHGFEILESRSITPEAWFRLNLKAFLDRNENQLDSSSTWLDSFPIRLFIMALLRIIELPFRERDCLVMKFKKVK